MLCPILDSQEGRQRRCNAEEEDMFSILGMTGQLTGMALGLAGTVFGAAMALLVNVFVGGILAMVDMLLSLVFSYVI